MTPFEIWAIYKLCFHQFRLEVIEINAGERLRNMQFARLAVKADTVPIDDAIRRV